MTLKIGNPIIINLNDDPWFTLTFYGWVKSCLLCALYLENCEKSIYEKTYSKRLDVQKFYVYIKILYTVKWYIFASPNFHGFAPKT